MSRGAPRSPALLAALAVLLAMGASGCGDLRDADGAPDPGPPARDAGAGEASWDERDGDPDDLPVAESIRNRLEAGLAGEASTAAGHRLLSRQTLPDFYEARQYRPAWLDGSRPTARKRDLVSAIRDAKLDGFEPNDYHLAVIDSLTGRLGGDDEGEVRRRADLDLLLTDAFLVLGSHLLHGRVNPESRDPEWRASRRGTDMRAVLEEALENGDVSGALDGLRPPGDTYGGLREALQRYREVAADGGWGTIPSGPVLEQGTHGPRVAVLRSRLVATGDLPREAANGAGDPELFDEELDRAVRRIQTRFGLEADGRAGPITLRTLNVPVEDRIAQVEVNLERWRWMPQELGDRYFLVNIAAFRVELWEEGTRTRTIRGIVGRHYRQTPVFSGTMTYLVLAPHWHVPPGIARNDQLPRIQANPGYLASQRMTLLDQGTNRVVDPHSVDWSGMGGTEFNRRFRIRQDPGPQNALGDVKFMFPNRFNVYLHDTPGRELFERAARDFSSGCIRVEGALDLAAHLLREDPSWTPERIREVVRVGRERYVNLPTPYQVHLQYWTAWLDEEGRVNFREDIYDRDPRVRQALTRPAPVV
jgi:L,D-transpeptidase YcbB